MPLEYRRSVDDQHDHGAWFCAMSMVEDDGRSVPIHDVIGGIEKGIDPSTSWTMDAIGLGRQLEVEGRASQDGRAGCRRS